MMYKDPVLQYLWKDFLSPKSHEPKLPGGALGFLGGCIRSLSKFKNTPKALISGQKSTLILIKR